MTELLFRDRVAAGRALGRRLTRLRDADAVVLGLPRGGVPVAFEVAAALRLPLDVIIVRKIGVPSDPELAMGAVGEDNTTIVNTGVVTAYRVSDADLTYAQQSARAEVARRASQLRGGQPRVPVRDRTAIIVDDGTATGATARAGCQVARTWGAAWVVVAVPVSAPEAVTALKTVADEVVCLGRPDPFRSVGQYYEDFTPTTDAAAAALLEHAGRRTPGVHVAARPPLAVQTTVRAGGMTLQAQLDVPPRPRGVVVFAHGSGSSRHNPRNQAVARQLRAAGLATVLLDLLTADEEQDRRNVFNVALLAGRLADTVRQVHQWPATTNLPVGLFGASTGTAAALQAATDPELRIAAIVSRGGRPDLAWDHLAQATAPTLLIVGGADQLVLEVNRRAEARLRGPKRLVVLPGAGHLFEEPGALPAVAGLAASWYVHYLRDVSPPTPCLSPQNAQEPPTGARPDPTPSGQPDSRNGPDGPAHAGGKATRLVENKEVPATGHPDHRTPPGSGRIRRASRSGREEQGWQSSA